MDKEAFRNVLLDDKWQNFWDFAGTENIEKGEGVYHWCKFCPYVTDKVYAEMMEEIDEKITDHLWEMHRETVLKMAQDILSRHVAATPGQTKLVYNS
jgi:hypothetical protein